MMLISVAVLSALHYAANRVGVTDLVAEELPYHREYFEFISRVALLFVAFATPELLVPDREQGVLAVYLSRPLRTLDYLAAKAAALGILFLAFLLVPQTIFHLLLGVFSPDGFTTYMVDNLDVLWQVPAASVVYFFGYASVALIFATLIPRVGFAAGIFLAVMIMLNPLTEFLAEFADFAGSEFGALLALEAHPHLVRDWIFGAPTGGYQVVQAGFEPGVALATIVGMAALALAVAWSRYRRFS
jgi:ABC-2 type transport system permease protein